MGMWTEREMSRLTLARGSVVRSGFVLFGLAGLLWACGAMPTFWVLQPLSWVAERMLSGEILKPGSLVQMLVSLESSPKAVVVSARVARASAILKLGVGYERDAIDVDRKMQAAEEAGKASLAQNPADSMLWLMLVPLENDRSGFDPSNLRFLAQSYSTGPLEGWIALRRNRIALSVFPMLGGTLQDLVVAEFASMVDSDLVEAAMTNLTGVGWSQRERLLAELGRVDVASKQNLAKRLAREGIKVSIPGIEADDRPW